MVEDKPSEYPPAWTEEMIQEYEQELAEDVVEGDYGNDDLDEFVDWADSIA